MKNCALFFTIFTIFIWPEITHMHTQIIAGLFQRPEKTWISKTVRVTLSTRRENCVIITFWFLYFFYRQKLNRFFFIAWRCAWFLIFVLFVIRILFSRLMIMMMMIITIFLPITIFLGFQACFSLFFTRTFFNQIKVLFHNKANNKNNSTVDGNEFAFDSRIVHQINYCGCREKVFNSFFVQVS